MEPKGADTICYTFKGGASTVLPPKSAFYLCGIVRSPRKDHPALAASIDAYPRGVFCCGRYNSIFYHFLPSEQDPEIFLSLQGWPSEREGREYWEVSPRFASALWLIISLMQMAQGDIHMNFWPAMWPLMTVAGGWEGGLQTVTSSEGDAG